jgi:beta-lactamase regulating signal transducer with metallopeptidase domain
VHLVLNWLWQGGVVALAAAVLLRAISPARAQARYCAAWAACASVLILPIVPFFWSIAASFTSFTTLTADAAPALAPIVSVPHGWWTSTAVAIGAGAVWSAGYALRVAAAAIGVRRARAHSIELSPELAARLRHWTRIRTTGRPARAVVSDSVRSAGVLGCGAPVIAVAPALLDRLSDADLDRVMVHEWAHVQRRDDLAQVAQLCVRILAGWHPALWWLDRQLHIEREAACDDAAVAVTGSAKQYAACLATLASFPAAPASPLPVLAVSSGGLRHRIVRILSRRDAAPMRFSRATAVSSSAVLALVALIVGGLPAVEAAATASVLRVEAAVTSSSSDLAQHVAGLPIAVPPAQRELRAVSLPTPAGRPAKRAASAAASKAVAHEVEPASSPANLDAPQTPRAPGMNAPRDPLTPSRSIVGFTVLEAASRNARAAESSAVTPSTVQSATEGWSRAADAGVAVGRASQKAGTATAGLFTRFGKKIAGSF